MNCLATKNQRACFVYYMIFENCALLHREAKALKNKGFEVDIVSLRCAPHGKIVQMFDGLRLYRIQSRTCPEKTVRRYLLRVALFFCKAFLLLTILGMRRKYALIHITTPPDFMVFTALVPKILGAKVILDIHDIGPELFMRKLNLDENHCVIRFIKFVEKISARFADHLITVTDIWKEKLVTRSVPCSRCTVLLNVPDEELFQGCQAYGGKKGDDFNIYYHGSLEEHFGVDTMLSAMPLIKGRIPKVKMHIYGSGRLAKEFQRTVKTLKMDTCVRFYDRVPFYEIINFLREADLGIVPTKGSVFSEEALSMKSFDYISLGIPIVISKTKAHRQYFDDSMVKFFEPEDPLDLAQAIIALYQDKQARKRLAQNSQCFIQRNGWQQQKQIYYQVVDRLLTPNKQGDGNA